MRVASDAVALDRVTDPSGVSEISDSYKREDEYGEDVVIIYSLDLNGTAPPESMVKVWSPLVLFWLYLSKTEYWPSLHKESSHNQSHGEMKTWWTSAPITGIPEPFSQSTSLPDADQNDLAHAGIWSGHDRDCNNHTEWQLRIESESEALKPVSLVSPSSLFFCLPCELALTVLGIFSNHM